jgi:hypothetical protein
MIPARQFSDTEIVRQRAGSITPPPPSRFNALAWTALAFFLMGLAVGIVGRAGL